MRRRRLPGKPHRRTLSVEQLEQRELLTANVSIEATVPSTQEGSGSPAVFTITRDETTGTLDVFFEPFGTAQYSSDYLYDPPSTDAIIHFDDGQATAILSVYALFDGVSEGDETAVVALNDGPDYDVVPLFSSATADILNSVAPPLPAPLLPGGGGGHDLIGQAPGLPSESVCPVLPSGVRPADGAVLVTGLDLASAGFGLPWGISRSWTNVQSYDAAGYDGNNIVLSEVPYLRIDGSGDVAVISNGTTARLFDFNAGSYQARAYLQETLVLDSGTGEYVLTDRTGVQVLWL